MQPALAGLGFLLGRWSDGEGRVADGGGRATGSSDMEPAANGAAIVRRDHTDLLDSSGRPQGGFDQVMLIYADGGAIHGVYLDGSHVIHYASAEVVPGQSAVFSSQAQAGAPAFRLAYRLISPKTLSVSFSMAPPGSADFRPIATGSLTRGD